MSPENALFKTRLDFKNPKIGITFSDHGCFLSSLQTCNKFQRGIFSQNLSFHLIDCHNLIESSVVLSNICRVVKFPIEMQEFVKKSAFIELYQVQFILNENDVIFCQPNQTIFFIVYLQHRNCSEIKNTIVVHTQKFWARMNKK